MYQIEIDNKRLIEFQDDLPKIAFSYFLEIVRRNPEKEVLLLKDGDFMMSRGTRKIWTGYRSDNLT